jgi:hypothetical protein
VQSIRKYSSLILVYCFEFFMLSAIAAISQPLLSISQPQQKYSAMIFPCDAVSATLKQDTNTLITFLSSADRTYTYSGPIDGLWKKSTMTMHADFYGSFSSYALRNTAEYAYDHWVDSSGHINPKYHVIENAGSKVNLYLKNVHRIGPNELLGFLHVEYIYQDEANPYPAYYSIALSHSTNNGVSWTFCGDIIRTNNTSADSRCNIGGAAYIIKDGCYYVYFNEVDGAFRQFPSVACAETSEVNSAARMGQITDWRKFNSVTNAFDIVACSGTPGLGSKIIPETMLPSLDMHTDAAYCSALSQYLLIVKSSNNLYLLRSRNGIAWSNPQKFASVNSSTMRVPSYPFFASLASDANEDCSIVGKSFYIYFTNILYPPDSPGKAGWNGCPKYKGKGGCRWGAWRADGTDLALWRVKVGISD